MSNDTTKNQRTAAAPTIHGFVKIKWL